MEKDNSMVDHVNKLKTIAEHLEALEDPVSEKDLVMILISSLPDEYNNLITTLETLKEDRLTWDYVRDRVITEFERRKGDDEKENIKGPQDALFVGGGSGNKKKFWNKNNGNTKKFPCHYCHETGHFIKDCPKKKESENKSEEKEESASFCNSSKMSKLKFIEKYEGFSTEI